MSDIRNICSVERLSGALDATEPERPMIIANWLAKNVTSDAGRNFLASLSRTQGEDKAALLVTTATRLGLTECPLADAWLGNNASQASPE